MNILKIFKKNCLQDEALNLVNERLRNSSIRHLQPQLFINE